MKNVYIFHKKNKQKRYLVVLEFNKVVIVASIYGQ